jgi:hypothetical protein
MCRKDGRKRPRPAKGVREGLSYMNGNIHVWFLGEEVAVTSPPYPTPKSFERSGVLPPKDGLASASGRSAKEKPLPSIAEEPESG